MESRPFSFLTNEGARKASGTANGEEQSPVHSGKGKGKGVSQSKAPNASRQGGANSESSVAQLIPDSPPWRMFVRNLPYNCTETDISNFFITAATPQSVVLHMDPNQRFKGTCFVNFSSREDMINAFTLDGQKLNGRPVGCSIADSRPPNGTNSPSMKPMSHPNAKPGGRARVAFRPYTDYLDFAAVEEGIKAKRLVVGVLHCTKYTHSVAFVRNPLFVGGDVVVDGWTERNRALPGDVVVVQLHPKSQWKERTLVPSGEMSYPTPKRPGGPRDLTVDTQAAARLIKGALGTQVNSLAFHHPPVFEANLQPTGDIVYILEHRPAFEEKTVICRYLPGDQSAATKASKAETVDLPEEPDEEEIPEIPYDLEEDEETGEVFVFHGVSEAPSSTTTKSPSKAPVPAVPLSSPFADPNVPPRPAVVPPSSPDRFLKFRPDNPEYPIVLVPEAEISAVVESQDRPNYLYLLRLCRWEKNSQLPVGQFVMFLGKVGTIEAETRALLRAHEVCTEDFSDEIYEEVNKPFVIPPPEELKRQHRRDLRKVEFACTIDPATARDLDDALSCEQLPDGSFRVGVHIADVSHFVTPDSHTDMEATKRCTTVYLVQRAIPMLPRILSEDYCSLNANQDKFAFSVIWRMNKDGEILSEWFGKSVIHNYCRMSYDMAQQILDGTMPDDGLDLGNVSEQEKPQLCERVRNSVRNLNAIATVLRAKRFANGCLRLQRNRLGFVFPKVKDDEGDDTRNDDTRFAPQGIYLYETQQSNHLVEEFMLLANIQVAQKLVTWLPVQSLVRRHGGPLAKKLGPAQEVLEEYGYKINCNSGPAMAQSLSTLGNDRQSQVVRLILTYCMQLAKYCCSDDSEGLGLHHFALNVPLYTHFTSPIRRYADVMVHRALEFVLELEKNGEQPPPMESLPLSVATAKDTLLKMKGMSASSLLESWTEAEEAKEGRSDFRYTPEEVEEICQRCNDKKYKAKKASDESIMIYFCYYLKSLQRSRSEKPFLETVGHVVAIDYKKKNFSLFIPQYALDYVITPNESDVQPWEGLLMSDKPKTAEITWKSGKCTEVRIMTTFEVRIQYVEKQGRMAFDVICLKEIDF